MKKTTFILLIMLTLSLILASCGNTGGGNALSEVAESNRKKAEVRQAFLSSEQYKAAYEYVENAVKELTGLDDYSITLEPGSFYREDFSQYVNIAENTEQRIDFLEKAQLYMTVRFWDVGIDGEELAKQIAERGITCELEADEYNSAYYVINGRENTVTYTIRPGV